MKKKLRKIKSFLSKNKITIITVAFILMMVASSFGAMMLQEPTTTTTTSSQSGYFIGTYGGLQVYQVATRDYYAVVDNVEWHFRVNPQVAGELNLTKDSYNALQFLRLGNEFLSGIVANRTINRVGLLLDPDSNSRTAIAASEISAALGANNWQPEVFFTAHSDARPDIINMSLENAMHMDDAVIFHLYVNESSTSGRIATFGPLVIVQGRSFDELDLLATKIKMVLIGWE